MRNYKFKVKNFKKLKRELSVFAKVCTKCGELKLINDFGINYKIVGGRENQCRERRRKKYKHTCEVCGKEFISDKKNSKTCSRECNGKRQQKKVKYNCDYCGKECEQIPAEYDKYKNHYCSSECKSKHQGLLYGGEDSPLFSQIKFNCLNCGKECSIKKSQYERNEKHFCSTKCMGEWYSINRVGENHPRWRGDLTEEERKEDRRLIEGYHTFRQGVLKRDNYTCVISGEREKLVVHHLYAYRDYKELRTEINNGVTLTEELHKEFHKLYGSGDNTLEQFKEFYKNKTGKDFEQII